MEENKKIKKEDVDNMHSSIDAIISRIELKRDVHDKLRENLDTLRDLSTKYIEEND